MTRTWTVGLGMAGAIAACGGGAKDAGDGSTPPSTSPGPTGGQVGDDAGRGPGGPAPGGATPQDGGTAQDAAVRPDAAAGDAAIARVTTLRVHYPAGARSVAVRGSRGPLTWTQGVTATRAGDVWTFASDAVDGPLEWKPLLDDATWSRGPNYRAAPGETVDVYPHFTTVKGAVSLKWPAFTGTALGGAARGIWVYLPPSYDENPLARFPVVYMHDGGNLFDGSRAFGGNEWKVDETLDAAAEDGTIREAIVIGVEATAARIDDYTPTRDAGRAQGGRGDAYLAMLAGEVKPMVDAALRTMPARETTAVLGSSLGGLISAYAGVRKADVFGLVGALSPSTWWDGRAILREVESVPTRPARALEVYVDSGDPGDDVTNTNELAATYARVGYVEGTTLKHVVQPGATHSEVYWAQRLPGALAFLLGPRDR